MAQLDTDLFTEQELTCSICLDLFSEPVSTPCGHNFCQGCIGGYWASSSVCTCPLCKRVFEERPNLSINRVFAHIAQKYKEVHYDGPPQPKPRQRAVITGASLNDAEQILCDVCSGKKMKAVSSCLTCTASYCEIHILPHQQTPFYASHQLLDPREALRGRTCQEHHRLLEVYCRTDQKCICAICVLEEHRTHTTVSVQTERASKQRLLGKTELDLQTCVDKRNAQLTELKSKLHALQSYAQAELSEVEQLLSDVTHSVDRIRTELVGGIEEKREAVIGQGQSMVTQLETKLAQLQERRGRLEAQAISNDHIGFLQSFEEANSPLQDSDMDMHEVDELTLIFSLGDVKAALGEIRERLDDIRFGEVHYRHSVPSLAESESMMSVRSMKRKEWSLKDLRISKTGHKKVKSYLEDVTLNPTTAYPFLILSEDRKQMKRGEKLQFYRNNSLRFDVWSCVLAKDGYESGRHYWEVNVGENKDWKLGVVRESAQRKGLFDMTPAIGYYALWWSGKHLHALTALPLAKVKITGHLRRIGIYLDCEEGQLVFYNAKTGSEVYTFTVTCSEKLFPLFGTGDKDVPLMLMSPFVSVPE
ncbi:bloodthirsty-related gene family, member 30 [Carassius auratus]|uniref:E3 ubiquitin-protein ligase TRIM7-like n=1 Tax=Carassius auratus TaxID=7957 RepID=A0A6P6MJW5_CARAU|nr:E3 ubiquitin-protein ligase TRIM7-like [Carassius auratus]XP_026097005.1 E3 ubiquitin-protein ligase TRIM7-like [Carassius auratus]XP_026097006.1 E3 ubiquitin-protein ligase TRIM7-like [Carassius auratus]XP_052388390.1 E3 ubiquitin-protein ligase TRIM7-like [Carassius gibelio]XP_052388391.1 E3 ubiquitin-protein ligase TRIM7-like [Carassius gibelio]